jgi:sulfur carrier protein
MEIVLNGDPRTAPLGQTIQQLVEALGLPAPALLVEHNGEALRRSEWDMRVLQEGDRVEIIRIVAGG